MLLHEKTYTVEEFWEIARLPENEGRRLELENGVIVEMASSSPLNSATAVRISYFLTDFNLKCQCGYVVGADSGFVMSGGNVRQPDAAFVSKKRFPALPDEFDAAPDIAVEVVSDREDVHIKAQEYLHSGGTFVWAVYAEAKTVYVFRLDEHDQLISTPFRIDDTLTGGDVLPGFTLPVRDIFPE
ncbi:MAG: hypothetical protein BroJett018_32890 [Chloroflexota bacterium]|nr:Uma2 family endonuclease [Anaerolineae bacterium]GIK65495.1 MAG: hypothetical protein BroJett018_32890 [Chloroflexota bacterium]